MAPAIIELNDAALRLCSDQQSFTTRGVAVVEAQRLLLGDEAWQQLRLQPRNVVSRFWSHLSLEPSGHPNPHYRHHADLAYQQLCQLHQQSGEPEEVVLVVPSHYNPEQLSILLGVAQQCPFTVCGLVESSVAACVAQGEGDVLHLELQLHQAVLSKLQRNAQGWLEHQWSERFPEAGLLSLLDRWAHTIAETFIQQSRFDPLHDAQSEQALYAALPSWLAQPERELHLELESGARRFQAKLARQRLEQTLREALQPIQTLRHQSKGSRLLLGSVVAALPGIQTLFSDAISLPSDAAIQGVRSHLNLIQQFALDNRLVQSLPCAAEREPQPSTPAPTHLLFGHIAYPILNQRYSIEPDQLALQPSAQSLGAVWRAEGQLWVDGDALQLNGEPIPQATPLQSGDQLSTPAGDALYLIHTVAGDGA